MHELSSEEELTLGEKTHHIELLTYTLAMTKEIKTLIGRHKSWVPSFTVWFKPCQVYLTMTLTIKHQKPRYFGIGALPFSESFTNALDTALRKAVSSDQQQNIMRLILFIATHSDISANDFEYLPYEVYDKMIKDTYKDTTAYVSFKEYADKDNNVIADSALVNFNGKTYVMWLKNGNNNAIGINNAYINFGDMNELAKDLWYGFDPNTLFLMLNALAVETNK